MHLSTYVYLHKNSLKLFVCVVEGANGNGVDVGIGDDDDGDDDDSFFVPVAAYEQSLALLLLLLLLPILLMPKKHCWQILFDRAQTKLGNKPAFFCFALFQLLFFAAFAVLLSYSVRDKKEVTREFYDFNLLGQ